MLKRKFRLKNRCSFRYIHAKGQSVSSRSAVLQYVPTRGLKIGFSVSKKIGNSVQRNLVKRRLRECVRCYVGAIAPRFNCVFVARTSALTVDFQVLKAEVYSLLERAGVLKEEKVEKTDTETAQVL